MKNNLLEIFGTVELAFLMPVLVVKIAVNLFRSIVLKEKVDETETKYGSHHYLLSALFWVVFIGWMLYQSQFKSVTYVYACPTKEISKCYKVRADYIPKECEDTEWDNRGSHGGNCTDPYFDKIYFDNGGYITFEYCEMEGKDKWTCYAEDRSDGTWNLQISEVVKIKKQ